jgi:hypothetical protein
MDFRMHLGYWTFGCDPEIGIEYDVDDSVGSDR